ncbi:hypothetical protein EII12_04950 [Buchananella hordeovulneris]|uniref:hypothetical protein n=1 Tax=Buchananella hordeovulneris TaxID=52770 RepID=UPI000F600349|nr:hypothetical protein [Buchananella hordeovulneris]RRD52399.1 hypothetical protein EII12_04950 [Buchananella hordeovulneris]
MGGKGPEHWWGGLLGGAACLVGARAWWGSLFREALRSAERLLPVVTGVVLSGVSPLSNRLRDNWRVNKVPMPGRRAATRLV